MTGIVRAAAAAALVLTLAAPAVADEVFKGTLVCAKCALQRADAHECQDVLMVTRPDGTKAEYYITKNEVAEKAGYAVVSLLFQ